MSSFFISAVIIGIIILYYYDIFVTILALLEWIVCCRHFVKTCFKTTIWWCSSICVYFGMGPVHLAKCLQCPDLLYANFVAFKQKYPCMMILAQQAIKIDTLSCKTVL